MFGLAEGDKGVARVVRLAILWRWQGRSGRWEMVWSKVLGRVRGRPRAMNVLLWTLLVYLMRRLVWILELLTAESHSRFEVSRSVRCLQLSPNEGGRTSLGRCYSGSMRKEGHASAAAGSRVDNVNNSTLRIQFGKHISLAPIHTFAVSIHRSIKVNYRHSNQS